MDSIEEWRQYLLGARQIFEIWTDHMNLQYFKKPQKLNYRQARWVTELVEYDFKLFHKPGSQMTKADLLSRRADHERGENDNSNITVLKPEWFIHEILVESLDSEFVKRIMKARSSMDRVVKLALAQKEAQWEVLPDGVVLRQGRIYVPRDQKLREDIMRAHHDSRTDGHPGCYKTTELITRNYWWPGIHFDVRKYVTGCDTCQRTKAHRSKPKAPLNPNEVPSAPWEVVSVDLIGELPESEGHNAICVFVDRFSKQIHAVPTSVEVTALGMARLYRDHVFRHHGIPRKFIHDRGPQFESNFMRELYKLLGIEGNPSTAYHPQTDGQTERINQEIEQYLRIFINYHQNDWADWLALAEFSYNNREQSSTGYSPFYINTGRHPYQGSNPRKVSNNESATDFVKRIQTVRQDVEAALKQAAQTMKHFYDRTRGQSI